MKIQILTFDVLCHDKFICTLRVKHSPLFPIEEKELVQEVLKKRPTLSSRAKELKFFPTFI